MIWLEMLWWLPAGLVCVLLRLKVALLEDVMKLLSESLEVRSCLCIQTQRYILADLSFTSHLLWKYWVWDPVSADFHLFVGRSLLWWSLWPSQLLMGTKKTLFFFYSSSQLRTGFPSIVHTAHSGLGDVYKMLEVCCKLADLNVYVLWCLSYWGKGKKGQSTRESITKTLQNELKKDVGFAYITIPVET